MSVGEDWCQGCKGAGCRGQSAPDLRVVGQVARQFTAEVFEAAGDGDKPSTYVDLLWVAATPSWGFFFADRSVIILGLDRSVKEICDRSVIKVAYGLLSRTAIMTDLSYRNYDRFSRKIMTDPS